MAILYKSMNAEMCQNGFQFKKNVWYKIDDELNICHTGFHASKNIIEAMSYVNCEILAKVKVRGESIIQDDKQCWSEMKILKTWKWDKKKSLKLAIYAAESVLPNFEKEYPDDDRPRKAIEAAKKVLRQDSKKNREAARSAAESAARSAARSARSARSAARSAAEPETRKKYQTTLNKYHNYILKELLNN